MSFVLLANNMRLNFNLVGDIHNPIAIFIHGIMGKGSNLSGFINKFNKLHPDWATIAIDLRNHGASSKHWAPYSVAACAQDIAHFCTQLNIKPRAILGHSFGGKVALLTANYLSHLEQIWMLDCSPSVIKLTKPLGKSKWGAIDIIDMLDKISWPLTSRSHLIKTLIDQGVSQDIALWMSTNVMSDASGIRLIFVPGEIKAMLLDFMSLDGWPLITQIDDIAIHLVKAELGGRLSDEDIHKYLSLKKPKAFYHNLANAGHFLHIDNPDGLLAIMNAFY